jgi:hypothetical protein
VVTETFLDRMENNMLKLYGNVVRWKLKDGLTEYLPSHREGKYCDDNPKWKRKWREGYEAEEFNFWRSSKPAAIASGINSITGGPLEI